MVIKSPGAVYACMRVLAPKRDDHGQILVNRLPSLSRWIVSSLDIWFGRSEEGRQTRNCSGDVRVYVVTLHTKGQPLATHG